MSILSFPDQLRLLESFLGRSLPERVRELFRPDSVAARQLLSLATGHESDLPNPNASAEQAFVTAQANFNSVLGHAMAIAEVARFEPDNVWPSGLLIVEDCGCSIYRAIDLESSELRVIEYEHFEPVPDPQAAVGVAAQLAYSEPAVPKHLQHQFIVVAPTLDDWLSSLRA